jgi:phosphoribosyl-ATP pyrophosphohydrolase
MILDDIYQIILERKKNPSTDSYVSSLLSKGKDEILKKIGEESVEVIIASKTGDKKQIIDEMADLWFHCLVLLADDGVSHEEVFAELRDRFGKKGKENG